ncbi:SPARC [Trichogramma pretiosum]|uniref:SPARC n=1 Tax=Trichogramma pretiosum TaxID=7493 RepID=UPI0006C958FE|nr:SPARC [Trichogramma pretiosum]
MIGSKVLLIGFLVAGLLFIGSASAEKRRKHHRRIRTTTEASPKLTDENVEGSSHELNEELNNNTSQEDLCRSKHCAAGRVCQVNKDSGAAECVCIEKCGEENDPRRHVCTNYNETFGSDCEVYQARCFCDTNDPRCKGPDYQHVHIEYYGQCKQMPACKEEDRLDFPRRMRDWLFNIMRDLADRQELTHHYVKMQREAESNHTLRWSNAAIWKWCDLDGHPHDRSVSRHELFPIRAPLMALEHCIAPFLDSCDTDNDHKITLKEWGKCLELEEDDLEEQCDHLAESAEDLTY